MTSLIVLDDLGPMHMMPSRFASFVAPLVALGIFLSKSTNHNESRLTLQLTKGSKIHNIIVDIFLKGTYRYYVRFLKEENGWDNLTEENLFSNEALLVLTIDLPHKEERFQTLIPFQTSLLDTIHAFFKDSLQIETKIMPFYKEHSHAFLFLQKLPPSKEILLHQNTSVDIFAELSLFVLTLKPQEIFNSPPQQVLQNVFAEYTPHMTSEKSWDFECTCSQEKAATLSLKLNKNRPEDKKVPIITCEFCKTTYVIDLV